MSFKVRQASPTDGPTLMHIELACRVASTFLPEDLRWSTRPRMWRQWLQCAPPFDRVPSERRVYAAYEHNEIFGFIAAMHGSIYAGYDADISAIYVLPRYRRRGIGRALMTAAARWLLHDSIGRTTADCYAGDPSRAFFDRMGGFVIASTSDDADPPSPAAVITYGFANLKEIAQAR